MRKVISILLAILMLTTNVGFAVNTHFCGGLAVKSSFSIGIHELDCGMANMDQECETNLPRESQIIPKPCCEDTHQVILMDDEAEIQSVSMDLNQTFFTTFLHTFIQPIIFTNQAENHFAFYPTPPLKRDIQILFQSFLI